MSSKCRERGASSAVQSSSARPSSEEGRSITIEPQKRAKALKRERPPEGGPSPALCADALLRRSGRRSGFSSRRSGGGRVSSGRRSGGGGVRGSGRGVRGGGRSGVRGSGRVLRLVAGNNRQRSDDSAGDEDLTKNFGGHGPGPLWRLVRHSYISALRVSLFRSQPASPPMRRCRAICRRRSMAQVVLVKGQSGQGGSAARSGLAMRSSRPQGR